MSERVRYIHAYVVNIGKQNVKGRVTIAYQAADETDGWVYAAVAFWRASGDTPFSRKRGVEIAGGRLAKRTRACSSYLSFADCMIRTESSVMYALQEALLESGSGTLEVPGWARGRMIATKAELFPVTKKQNEQKLSDTTVETATWSEAELWRDRFDKIENGLQEESEKNLSSEPVDAEIPF